MQSCKFQSSVQLKVNGKLLSLALHELIVNGQFHYFLCTATSVSCLNFKKRKVVMK